MVAQWLDARGGILCKSIRWKKKSSGRRHEFTEVGKQSQTEQKGSKERQKKKGVAWKSEKITLPGQKTDRYVQN